MRWCKKLTKLRYGQLSVLQYFVWPHLFILAKPTFYKNGMIDLFQDDKMSVRVSGDRWDEGCSLPNFLSSAFVTSVKNFLSDMDANWIFYVNNPRNHSMHSGKDVVIYSFQTLIGKINHHVTFLNVSGWLMKKDT